MGKSSAKLFGLFRKSEEIIAPAEERQPGQKVAPPIFIKPEKLDKRAVSGQRVVCACSMELPKIDAFSQVKAHRKGFLVFNTRGGAFYTTPQFSEHTVSQLFHPGKSGGIRNFKFYPRDKAVVEIGQVTARFLSFTDVEPISGMVIRFGDLDDEQMDMLNLLISEQPKVGPSEHAYIQKLLLSRQ